MVTISVNTWGKRGLGCISVRVADTDIEPIDAVRRSVERRTGLRVCGCRSDGTALDRKGQPESRHYQMTLGLPCRTGGYSVEGEIWAAIPVAS